jgi:hypothetical protein
VFKRADDLLSVTSSVMNHAGCTVM